MFLKPVPYWREVQIVVPSSPRFFIKNDVLPRALGYNRPYRVPSLPSGQSIVFPLAPGQFLTGAVEEGHGNLTVISFVIDPPSEAAQRHEGD